MGYIDIRGLDKVELLQKLYNAAKPIGLGQLHYQPGDMTLTVAQHLCSDPEHLKFDYIMGRVLKVNLAEDWLDVWLYDRDNGEGAASQALNLPTVENAG